MKLTMLYAIIMIPKGTGKIQILRIKSIGLKKNGGLLQDQSNEQQKFWEK